MGRVSPVEWEEVSYISMVFANAIHTFLITEMFVKVRNVLQFRAPLTVNPLRSSSQQAAVRSSQASPLGKWDILAAVCIGNTEW